MEQDQVLCQWDPYEAHHFVDLTQFSIASMDRYTYLTTQCQQAVETIEDLESGRKNAKEILKK